MIAAMLRIKNEDRWIHLVLASLSFVCDKIFIMDDHSTDRTRDVCLEFPRVHLLDSPFGDLNECRDKQWLLERIGEAGIAEGNWVISIDGDELIHANSLPIIKQLAVGLGQHDAYRFRVLYLWNDTMTVRWDGVYGRFTRPSMFRYRPGARFISGSGGGFHCGNVPDPNSIGAANVNLLHFGYMYAEDRLRKYDWYNLQDPNNTNEDYYRHMVVGDVFPVDAQFAYGGPLKLVPLEEIVK